MSRTKIEWSEFSWSPVIGCTKIAAGCKNCYAERMAWRLACMEIAGYKKVVTDLGWRGNVAFRNYVLDKPLHWRKPRRIFVCSMSDLFHEDVPFEFLDEVFGIMHQAPQHRYQILTKRPQKMLDYISAIQDGWLDFGEGRRDPPPFICLGVSCSNQADADKNIPILLQIPAGVRFVSFEPLLEEIRSNPTVFGYTKPTGRFRTHKGKRQVAFKYNPKSPALDWVIVGGESGPGARPMHPNWVRDIRDQCVATGVPFFFKGWGGVNKKKAGRILDGRTWDEYPKTEAAATAKEK